MWNRMTVLYDVGDGIKGEKISCEFRKASKSTVIRKTSGHKLYVYLLRVCLASVTLRRGGGR
jgi:hypothetical protein